MSNKKTAIIVSASMAVLVVGIITFAVIQASPSTPKTSRTTKKTVATSTPEAVSQGSGGTLGVSTQAGDGLGLQSNLNGGQSNSNGSGSSGSQVPGPDSFSDFEQYKDKDTAMFMDIAAGSGTEVADGTKVAVTYKGWLTDGTLFDQSQTGEDGKIQAFSFVVGAHTVVPGWEQAIVGMKIGGTRRMIVPPAVGYGAEGKGNVPPNALMIFDVTLHAAL